MVEKARDSTAMRRSEAQPGVLPTITAMLTSTMLVVDEV